jgi:hypothetical protein
MTTATIASTSSTATPRLPRAALATTAIWFTLAALTGAVGLPARLPFPSLQIAILALFAASLAATSAVPSLRAWIDALPVRTLAAIHAVRFVGGLFLILGARGLLAQVFASRAGWGDMAAATVAVILVATGEPRTPGHRAAYHAWNVLGALDLIVAVATATWVVINGLQPGMEPLFAFPLATIPLFFIPVLLVGHVVVFRRLMAAGGTGGR